jgi:hypothetical protein
MLQVSVMFKFLDLIDVTVLREIPGFYGGNYEDDCLAGRYAVQTHRN